MLRHADRWRAEYMLREQPELKLEDQNRDMELWLHLFEPSDLVKVGEKERAMSISLMWQVWGDNTIESRGNLLVLLALAAVAPESISRGQHLGVVAQIVRSSELGSVRFLCAGRFLA